MKNFHVIAIVLIALFTTLSTLNSCNDKKETRSRISPRIRHLTKIEEPKNGGTYKKGDSLTVSITTVQDSVNIESNSIQYQSQTLSTWNDGKYILPTTDLQAGNQRLIVSVKLSNGKVEKHTLSFKLLADQPPQNYSYRVINRFGHDTNAYTQGLLVDNGDIIESTGHKGESFLRRFDPRDGKSKRQYDLEAQYFGEGITMLGSRIFMLTWQSNIGFIFDKNSFDQLGTFNYATQGWGLTNIGDTLIMSDGTEYLYFIDPESFVQISKLQVYDHKGKIDRLNELEYINGSIYANVYETDHIVMIEPKSGFVTGILDLNGIFDKSTYSGRTDVLNGIAYDQDQNKLYVTGKWWPYLYEIEIFPYTQTIN